MIDPLFWLGLSILFVAFSLTVFLVAAMPALQEIARAARSIEKLIDTLRRELPPTLEAIRLTGMEISDLTDDVSDGVKSAGQIVKQVDQSIDGAKKQAQKAQVTTKSVFIGVKAAWSSLTRSPSHRSKSERLSPSQKRMRTSRLQQAALDENRVEPPVYRDYLESRQPSDDSPYFQPEREDFEPEE